MNTDDMLRRSRPQLPGWAASPAGRQTLESLTRELPVSASVVSPARRPLLGWSIAGTAVLAAAAAVAVALPGTTPAPAPRTPPPAAAGPGASPSAPQLLLAAATQAERTPDTGRYWRVKQLVTVRTVRIGTGANGYDLAERQLLEKWEPRNPGERGWFGYRSLGVRPATEADERAWRAAGSPTRWNVGPADSPDRKDVILTTAPDAGTLTRAQATGATYLGDLGGLDVAGVRALPTDPAGLRRWVDERLQRGMGIAPDSPDNAPVAFDVLTQLLVDVPAPAAVRAAAYRALAGIEGLRDCGEVKDANGRPGRCVGLDAGVHSPKTQMIIDPDAHTMLARERSSGKRADGKPIKWDNTVVLVAEWSDATPQIPTLP
ncbi:CU044_5270 family protein [Micromonospora sp. NPDC049559]|uniref:CU044_5270 family protein n=1 Tax=Micromonospora sp. NPDC049559 TaxID=3155923 RepID=UPI0034235DA7